MTPAQLMLARNGAGNASAAATAMWGRLVGSDPDAADRRQAGAALDAVSQHVGATTDVPDWTLEEAVFRCSRHLDLTSAGIGIRKMEDGMEFGAATASLRNSGAMSLLAPWAKIDAGVF